VLRITAMEEKEEEVGEDRAIIK
jgi:hypothetical protein